jgi:hypothetical protein
MKKEKSPKNRKTKEDGFFLFFSFGAVFFSFEFFCAICGKNILYPSNDKCFN